MMHLRESHEGRYVKVTFSRASCRIHFWHLKKLQISPSEACRSAIQRKQPATSTVASTTKHARFAATTQHATLRSTNSSQLKRQRAGQDSSEDTSVNEQTTRNKNTPCLCSGCARCCSLPEFRHMWCMRAGRVDVCTAFCLYYKMHLSLSLSPSFCLCACSQLFR